MIGKTPPISSIEVKQSISSKPVEKVEPEFPIFQGMGDLSDSDSEDGCLSAPLLENILSALSPPSISTPPVLHVPSLFEEKGIDNGYKASVDGNKLSKMDTTSLSQTDESKSSSSKFSSIFDLPPDIPSKVSLQSNVETNTSKSQTVQQKRLSLDKPESREKKNPSPKLKETWLVNPIRKQKETKVYESPATPLRIPKITIKNNFRNELQPKNKESASDLNTPSLKIKLLRTYDGEWTTSDKKKKRREKDKKIKPVMISLLKSPDKGRRSPCLIIRKENLIEKENKSNIKIKIKKTLHNNTPQLKRLKIKELPHRDDLNAEDRENTCETPLAVVTSQPPAPKPVEELLQSENTSFTPTKKADSQKKRSLFDTIQFLSKTKKTPSEHVVANILQNSSVQNPALISESKEKVINLEDSPVVPLWAIECPAVIY